MRFTCVCTDIETGKAVYHDLPYGDERDIEWIRASSAIPVATRPVAIDGHKYLDGGVADSIPSAWLFAQGYDRNIVVLTQPAGFVKQPNSVMPMLRRVFRHYPEFVAALEHRHEVYNTTLDDLARREAAGEIFVVRPSESVKVPSLCREPDELERIYRLVAAMRRRPCRHWRHIWQSRANCRVLSGKRIPEWTSKLGCVFHC